MNIIFWLHYASNQKIWTKCTHKPSSHDKTKTITTSIKSLKNKKSHTKQHKKLSECIECIHKQKSFGCILLTLKKNEQNIHTNRRQTTNHDKTTTTTITIKSFKKQKWSQKTTQNELSKHKEKMHGRRRSVVSNQRNKTTLTHNEPEPRQNQRRCKNNSLCW